MPASIYTLEIYLCNSDTKEKYKATIQCYIAQFKKIRLNCGYNIDNEIITKVATIHKEYRKTPNQNTGKFKVIATRKFKKPKDK